MKSEKEFAQIVDFFWERGYFCALFEKLQGIKSSNDFQEFEYFLNQLDQFTNFIDKLADEYCKTNPYPDKKTVEKLFRCVYLIPLAKFPPNEIALEPVKSALNQIFNKVIKEYEISKNIANLAVFEHQDRFEQVLDWLIRESQYFENPKSELYGFYTEHQENLWFHNFSFASIS
ncbi:MAG: hypothetical protein Q7K21_07360, partial [Elusimicrobiota bacterium]|nr:hypothetical protein [Elusimicrobiota bacterium]